jgi:hypothetical protein
MQLVWCRIMIKVLIVILLLFTFVDYGQSQAIKGYVYLSDNTHSLAKASVVASQNGNQVQSTITDDNGFYELHMTKSGVYQLSVTFEKYVHALSLEIAEDAVLIADIYLDPMSIELSDVNINEDMYRFGNLTMTQRQFRTMPASFQDPSRIIIRYPGFSTANDGANSIIFRGLPPESTRWQLYGADIVNPNHLSNAGTANDLATNNAGGVNAFNGNVLDYYHFEANPAETSYGNVLSGVSDMKMAPSMKSYIDLNLIGLEAGVGSRIGDKNFYASYRYSFTGLLNMLGINFGNEKIGYQDISAYADLIKTHKSHLKIFATLGKSHNYFSGIDSLVSPERFKDIQHINYNSNLGIVGTQYTWHNDKFVYQSTLVASERKDVRAENTQPFFTQKFGINHLDDQSLNNRIISFHNQLIWNSSNIYYKAGLRTNAYNNYFNTNEIAGKQAYYSLYPYFQLEHHLIKSFGYTAGAGLMYDNYTNEFTAEPLVTLNYKPFDKISLKAAYRFASLQDYTDLRYIVGTYKPVRIKSNNLQLTGQYDYNNLKVALTGFYHRLHGVAKFKHDGIYGAFASAFNGGNLGFDQLLFPFWSADGTDKAKVYGVDVFFQKRISNQDHSWVFDYNLSLFSSKYRLAQNNNTYYHGRYDYGYVNNVSIGYEKNVVKIDKSIRWIASIAAHNRGGQREPILNPSALSGVELYKYDVPFTYMEPGYMRIDVRLVYSKKKVSSRLRHTWSLDIQNLMGKENFGYRYYDFLLKESMIQRQLGMIPVLSYRMIFE